MCSLNVDSVPPEGSASRSFVRVCEILDRYHRDPCRLIPVLQAVQDEYRYLPPEVMTYIATSLRIPPARVYGVATFYSHFALVPKGKYVVKLCNGTACHVKRSIPILEALQRRLQVTDDRPTTRDLLFTVETVSCLGACGLAPVMLVNEKVYGQVTPDSAVSVIEDILRREAP